MTLIREGLPRDVKEIEMMKPNDLDQGLMIKVAHLVRVGFLWTIKSIFSILLNK